MTKSKFLKQLQNTERELDNQLVGLFNNYVKFLNENMDEKEIEDHNLEKPKTLKMCFIETLKQRLFSKKLDNRLVKL